MNSSRRIFLATGTLGAVALAAGGFVAVRDARPAPGRALGVAGNAIVAALVPAFLDGALPAGPQPRREAIAATVAAVDTAVAGLPPRAQAELTELFGLLWLAPARIAVAGLWPTWGAASTAEVQDVLARWQASRVTLLRSAYDGLHQLIIAAWYGNPESWAAIGYPGPPVLG